MPYNKAAPPIQIIHLGREDVMTSLVPRTDGAKDGHGFARDWHTDTHLHPNWQEKLAAIDRLQSPANFTTVALPVQ
jgi:hypothetical protein